MRVKLRASARIDVLDAADSYNRQRDGLGDYFLDFLRLCLLQLESQAGIHERVFGYHRKLVIRFPFAIYYRIVDEETEVVAILACRRDPGAVEIRLRQE